NNLYNHLQELSFVNNLKTPVNGILYPTKENSHNLFRRQLIIEQGTFDDATEEYLQILGDLNKLDKVTELAVNQRLLIRWNKVLTTVMLESQNLIINKK